MDKRFNVTNTGCEDKSETTSVIKQHHTCMCRHTKFKLNEKPCENTFIFFPYLNFSFEHGLAATSNGRLLDYSCVTKFFFCSRCSLKKSSVQVSCIISGWEGHKMNDESKQQGGLCQFTSKEVIPLSASQKSLFTPQLLLTGIRAVV